MNTPNRPIRKGIKGIRKILAEDKRGWHIFLRGEEDTDFLYGQYANLTVDEIRDAFTSWTLWDFSGNGIYFSRGDH